MMTILYVDDDQDDIYLFTELLKEIDGSVALLTYTDAIKALNFLHSTSTLPDYIFSDMNMPRMSGHEFLSSIKKEHRFQSLRVIMYSTAKSESELKELKEKGAFRFVQKASTIEKAKADISAILSY